MKASTDHPLSKQLDQVIGLLQQLVALELAKGKVSQAEIGKHLKLAKSTVGGMLRGYDKGN